MKKLVYLRTVLSTLVFVLNFSFIPPVFSGALVHASVTGGVWAINRYHGQVVRFTIRDNGWPNALHDIVIKPHTHIYRKNNSREKLSANLLHKGEQVTAQGGVTTFGNRIVADRIIILGK